jgi:transcriptional antiterminator Rof (Rho-off)
LAQADDRSKLEAAQLVHLDMMKIEHGKKFAEKIAEINRLREKAENLASDVRKNMRRLEVS